MTNKRKLHVGARLDENLVARIDAIAAREQRSRSNVIEMQLRRALDGDGDGHAVLDPRITELAGDWLRGLVTGEELAREIVALVLAPPTVDSRQLRLELPTEVQA
jgi:hypothetical protein